MWWIVLVLSMGLFRSCMGELCVELPNGKVRGTTFDTPLGKTFYAWRGIPYGKPPLDDLRYLPPVKAEPWKGIRDGSIDAPACIQFETFDIFPKPVNGESEDCLYLNVYSPVPAGSKSKVKPNRSVLFWIYGGAYFAGFVDFGIYDPTPFLDEDVIVVTANYRLGSLGFLTTEDKVILGNAGLKDQLLALEWIKENIAFFGGNPKSVTIFGESAGALSCGYHIVSPKSRGLFKGAILQSGSALFSLAPFNSRDYALNLAKKIDSSITNSSTSEHIRNVLQAAPVDLLKNMTALPVYPALEVKSALSFLTEPIYETIESGNIARVPIIIGFNSEEWIVFGNDTARYIEEASMLDSDPKLLVPSDLKIKKNASSEVIGNEIHEQYVGKDGLFAKNLRSYLEYMADNIFLRSAIKHAVLQSKFTPVYMYQFSYFGTLSKNNLLIPGAGKVGHAQELGYLFNMSTQRIETEKDFLTRKRMVKLWTNFAKTSDPTPDDDSAELLQNLKWNPISKDSVQYLDIDENLELKPSRKGNKTIFWDNIWKTYGNRPYNTY